MTGEVTASGTTYVRPAADVRWDDSCDVVVVGTGMAGACAALAAARHGADVRVLEKGDVFGGTFAKSAGAVWIPRNAALTARGVDDDVEQATRFLARCARPQSYDPGGPSLGLEPWEHQLLRAYVEGAADVVEALRRDGALDLYFGSWVPDYQTGVEENVVKFGRVGTPLAADGRSATNGAGQAARFAAALAGAGVPVSFRHGVTGVVVDGDAVTGVQVTSPTGARFVRAAGGVVFASGGFTHDVHLRRAHLPAAVLGGAAVHTNTGDFVRVATALGAPLHAMHQPWLAPLPIELADDPDVCPVFVSPGDSLVYLNRFGARVVNEKSPYNEVARVFDRWDPARLEYSNLLLFMVFDQRVRDLWAPPAGEDPKRWALGSLGNYAGCDEVLVTGRDLDELAGALRERLAKLAGRTGGFSLDESFVDGARQAIERFNVFAEAGNDEDFHRGEAPIEQVFFGERRPGNDHPNPLLHPMSDGPYYALVLASGTLDTKGGPRIDVHGRVLGLDERPIPGLYGAGNCVASPFGQGYPAGGTPNGFALVFGDHAGSHAASRSLEGR